MTHYDPNDPQRSTATPERRVEPVEQRASALPLVIGILLALAIAYFAFQYLMGRNAVGTTGEDAAVTTTPADQATTAPATTTAVPETTTAAPAASTETPATTTAAPPAPSN